MNPLQGMTAQMNRLPPFSRIRPAHIEPAIDELLARNRRRISELLSRDGGYRWDNLIVPMEEMAYELNRTWSPVAHMNAVVNTPELRAAYNACLPKLSEYHTELAQNQALFRAYEEIATSASQLHPAQQKLIKDALREFRLAGVALPGDKKDRFRTVMQRLAQLQAKFEENVLDASNAWQHTVTDASEVSGIPKHALSRAREEACKQDLEGWSFTLDYPAYSAVITHADDRALRREFYEAWVTRASDQGPRAGQWDNTEIMKEILALRHEAANLVGFKNYTEYSLATKMAESPNEVMGFLDSLIRRTRTAAQKDAARLKLFAAEHLGIDQIEAWDIAYVSEKIRQKHFNISDEQLRPYFPVAQVLQGLFEVARRLFGIRINETEVPDTWHEDVRFYRIEDEGGEYRGGFFVDLYARANKRSGAWMDECVGRMQLGAELQYPVAYLICNFTPPVGNQPALLAHDEVITLFHEFGHSLHHVLTRVDYPSLAGINGVAWDAVELPSQFMENLVWQADVMPLISRHYETGDSLPENLFSRLLETRTFQAGMQMVRQVEFALFDFRLHMDYSSVNMDIMEALRKVRDRVAVIETPEFNRFPHSFSHIFSGGYAAGYYSYKWAEVLSADAFSVFEDGPVLDPGKGRRFMHSFLETGGSRDAMDIFVEFRGRKPRIDALLRHNGIDDKTNAAA